LTATTTARPTGADVGFPAPFDAGALDAVLSHGQRKIVLVVESDTPARVFHNAYDRIIVTFHEEGQLWSGECRWIWVERHVPGTTSYVTTGFTDKGRKATMAALVPVLNRYGFDRLWRELFDPRSRYDDHQGRARLLRAMADWHVEREELEAMHAEGRVELQPYRPEGYGREYKIRVPTRWGNSDWDWQDVVAKALIDGEHVGWLTKGGDLVPDDASIARVDAGVNSR
jgi:hypothetical protein